MLWYKSWLETRWRFLIGLALLLCGAMVMVLGYPRVQQLLPIAASVKAGGVIGREIREGVAVQQQFRGYIWWQWFRQSGTQMATLFAVLLGTGGLLSHGAGGAALFTLSMPVSRRRLLGTRAASGLTELFALALAPALVIPIVAPLVGERYGVGPAIVQALCLFTAASVFFSFAFLLSTMFEGTWPPLMIALATAIGMSFTEQIARELAPYGLFAVMSGEAYFRTGALPWVGLLACTTASAAMLYGAIANFLRQDF
jgi:ABC-2 type transport system permease protein